MSDAFEFRPYAASDEPAWNALVARSPNATFLFHRDFMGYHADRFDEASLMIWRQGRLVALLPANREGDRWISHGGLSYGGLVLADTPGQQSMWELVQALRHHLRGLGASSLLYKAVPSIYHRLPCEEDRWALWRCGAQLVRRDALSTIGPYASQWPPSRRRSITRANRQRAELTLHTWGGDNGGRAEDETADWSAFWGLLERELQARHGTRPVHRLAEARLLASRFPGQIRLKVARWAGQVVAGLVLFETHTVSHVQYMAADAQGRRGAALDLLVEQSIAEAQHDRRWFDFGHSNEDQGSVLNAGLVFYKESFGASTVVQDHYLLTC